MNRRGEEAAALDYRAEFFVLRTPLLPFDDFLQLGESRDREVALDRLRAVLARPELREAILVASPELAESLDEWLEDADHPRGRRIAEACLRYVARTCGRPTPFGLFAGCSVGSMGERTSLELEGMATARRHARLDMDLVAAVSSALVAFPQVRERLVFRPSSSLYRAGGRIRHVEASLRDGVRRHSLVALDPDPALDRVLARAEAGAGLAELIAALLEEHPDCTRDEARAYLDELIETQALVSDLEPAVTGDEPLRLLVDRLAACPEAEPVRAVLARAQRALDEIDASPVGADPLACRRLAADVASLPVKVETRHLVQMDLAKSSPRASLGADVTDEILAAVRLLQRIAPPRDPLAAFREAFVARYEGREVPLLEALDEESGVGFGSSGHRAADASPLLRDLWPEPAPREKAPPESAGEEARERVMLGLLDRALRRGDREVTLGKEELVRLEKAARESGEPLPLPDAFAAFASVAAISQDELDAGRFRVLLEHASGPSGATLLGRFCHGDHELRGLVLRHLRAEEALVPDAIFAELTHLPEGRAGNVLLRPALRRHEIPYLAASGVPAADRIPVQDLLVSVVGRDVRLRSARLGRRVLPRLTSAHAFGGGSVGVYRFLCMLQSQGTCGSVAWSWGGLAGAPFLPRVVMGRLVLARARWLVEAEDMEALRRLPDAERLAAVAALRAERGLPRIVLLADGDNELPVDLDNPASVDALLGAARGDEPHCLLEMFPSPEELAVFGPEGRFVSQIVVPFVRVARERAGSDPPMPCLRLATLRPSALARSFAPGSEWLYVKLYCGTATADRVLLDLVAPLVAEAKAQGHADRWFFLRYADPRPHLRVRLHGEASRLLRETLPRLHHALRPMLADGRVHGVQLDTYEREVERYGGVEGVEIAESVFEADSEAVVASLEHLVGDSGLDARWRLGLLGIDRLLDDLALDLDARLRVLAALRDSFGREHRLERQGKRLGERLRAERKSLETLREGQAPVGSPLAAALPCVAARSERLRPLAAELRSRAEAGRLGVSIEELASSFVHMHANRILRSAARAHEAVLYDFLWNLDESRQASARACARSPAPSSC